MTPLLPMTWRSPLDDRHLPARRLPRERMDLISAHACPRDGDLRPVPGETRRRPQPVA